MESFDVINFTYELIRSDRKTLAIQVKSNGDVVVRAPRRLAKKYIEAFVQEKNAWVIQKREEASLRAMSPYHAPLTAEEIDALYEKARKTLPVRVAEWAARMGVTPHGITVTAAKKRYGSCSSKGRLCFSYQLMRYPDATIDYVIVHELAHILHHDHSSAFWACVAHHMPDYKEREKILKT